MATNERTVKQERVIKAPPDQVFRALTVAGELREWMCDYARTEPYVGGHYEVRWHAGYEARGAFTALDPSRQVAFTWQGTGEPGETQVRFELMPADDGTKVTLTHTGFGPGPEWDEAVAESEKGWSIGLENLQSVLGTGIDLREARQPFLGINLEPLDPDRIAKEDIAAEAGIYLTGVVEGHGAEVAGLQRGDVIVGIDEFEVRDFDSLITALRAYRAGDRVEVAYVRGPEQLTTTVELGPRPMPEIPEDLAELAARIREQQEQINAELAEALAGLTEAAAKQAPAPGETREKGSKRKREKVDRKEMAFLPFSFFLFPFPLFLLGQWGDEGPGNPSTVPEKLAMALAAAPTVPALLDRFAQDQAETLALIEALTPETQAHKAHYRRIASSMLQMADHTREHIAQIRTAIQAVRR